MKRLNVAAATLRPPLLSWDSGPGRRWLLYVQGCRFRCTCNCLNPHLLDPDGGISVGLGELRLVAAQVAAGVYGQVEGLTVLGGEPSEQAEALLPLLTECHEELNLSTMVYSGHPLPWFLRPENVDVRRLLDYVDILVDGPFISSMADPDLKWRGSSNQKIRLLTSRYTEEDLMAGMAFRGVTLDLRADGSLTVSGLQDRAAASRVEGLLGVNRGQSNLELKDSSVLTSP